MNGQPKRGSLARQRAATAAVCSVLFAVVGVVLLATPANAGILGTSDACTRPTTLVDTTGASTGAVDVSGSTSGVTLGVNCETPVTLGDRSPTQSDSAAPSQSVTDVAMTPSTATSTATSTAADTTSTDAVATEPVATSGSDSSTTTANPGSTLTAAAAAPSTKLASLAVLRSSNTVYPAKDGFRDTVKFAVRAMNATGAFVPVVGSAVLSRASRTVESWHIDTPSTVITWDGRVKHAITSGLYTLTVDAWSPDGTQLIGHTMVRVLTKHLVKHAMVVRSDIGARTVAAELPHELLKAYAAGDVTVRVRTVAVVHSAAKLVFSNAGVSRSVALRNGTHTTKALSVPQGFSHVTITHDWAKGGAHLKSLKAIWTYYTLS